MSTTCNLRWILRRDMPEVLDIEASSFDSPWSEADFIRCLRQRNCIGIVAEQDNDIIGFVIYEMYATKLRLLNFAVAKKHRREGVGRRLLGHMRAKLSSNRRKRIVTEVRERNLAAQLFFRACGWKAVNMLHDYYEDTDEDAIVMQVHINAMAEQECCGV